MPEAAIDEDGNHQPRKNNVRDPVRFLHYLEINPVAQASLVQLSTQHDLSPGSLLPNFCHSATDFWR